MWSLREKILYLFLFFFPPLNCFVSFAFQTKTKLNYCQLLVRYICIGNCVCVSSYLLLVYDQNIFLHKNKIQHGISISNKHDDWPKKWNPRHIISTTWWRNDSFEKKFEKKKIKNPNKIRYRKAILMFK